MYCHNIHRKYKYTTMQYAWPEFPIRGYYKEYFTNIFSSIITPLCLPGIESLFAGLETLVSDAITQGLFRPAGISE